MTSFERLVASDPSRDAPYAPRDFDAMVSRVVSKPYARVLSWGAFKARVLAGFSASCAVMAAATYALAGAGPPLVRLTFAASAPLKATSAAPQYGAAVTGTGFVATAPRVRAGSISRDAASLAAYTVTAPSSESDTVATLARALGVRLGAPVAKVPAPPGTRSEWTARGEPGFEAVFVRVGGVDLWGYEPFLSTETPSAPSGAAPGVTSSLSASALAQRALDIVHALGTLDTGVPIVGTGGTFVRGDPTHVVVPILINGHWSNLTDNLFLDAGGRVISALGVMFSLGPPTFYPLISPHEAASHASAQAAIFAHGVTPSSWPGYEPSGATLPTGTLHLSQSTAQYRILVDAHGVAHALPIYQYVGRSDGSREVVLDALAIDPRYLVYEVHGSPTR